MKFVTVKSFDTFKNENAAEFGWGFANTSILFAFAFLAMATLHWIGWLEWSFQTKLVVAISGVFATFVAGWLLSKKIQRDAYEMHLHSRGFSAGNQELVYSFHFKDFLDYLYSYKTVEALCEREGDANADWMCRNLFPAERLRQKLCSFAFSHEVSDFKREVEAAKNRLIFQVTDDLDAAERAFKLIQSSGYGFIGKDDAKRLVEQYNTNLDRDRICQNLAEFFDEATTRISHYIKNLHDYETAERKRVDNELRLKELEAEEQRSKRKQQEFEKHKEQQFLEQKEREAQAVRARAEQAEKNALEIKKRAENILRLDIEKQEKEAKAAKERQLANQKEIEKTQKNLEAQQAKEERDERNRLRRLEEQERPKREEGERLKAEQDREDAIREAQEQHEMKLAKMELLKIKEQRLAAEAARDAAALAKAQESEQFAAILKSLKGDADEG